ncbi:dynamin central domain-containing protein [Artemisia annua]|uniref:Dynamin central domain-containing protein n=1 Tax=Artemisia annua TaxID=35608 RepID=A0A2U1QM26_ARTAN|nr:dynamin central domain-containing protein [Artemisia annua]
MGHGLNLGFRTTFVSDLATCMGTKRKACDTDDVKPKFHPLFSSYNKKIRPILNKLQHFHEGIPVPNIVVIGDQSSGKTSVMESLTGIRFRTTFVSDLATCMGTKRKACDTDDVKPKFHPLFSSYNKKIRPILNKLQHFHEGIPVPNIVVIGDQSSGKTSVMESLTGIRLTRCQTRLPLIISFKNHHEPVPEFLLGYRNKLLRITDESQIPKSIDEATVEIAGKSSKCIFNVPLTLVVRKQGVPNLTLIDLPGITWVRIHDQPENISQQILDIITEYIKLEETIILNVLSAGDIIRTCESIRMSQRVDGIGERTLAVVTKCDLIPEGSFIKEVMANVMGIDHLDYICLRNRINDETFDEARIQEAKLFETHPLLSKLDKSKVGFPVLADKLVQIQSAMISKRFPYIGNKMNEKLNVLIPEHNKLPESNPSVANEMAAFTHIVESIKEALRKILINGEFDEKELYRNQICGNARLNEMIDNLTKELRSSVKFSENFLTEEIRVLEATNGIRLPGYFHESVFKYLINSKIKSIAHLPISFVNEVLAYIESVWAQVLIDLCGDYPQLLCSMRRVMQNVLVKMKKKFMKRVVEHMDEKRTCYTSHPDFVTSYERLIANNHEQFSKAVSSRIEEINIAGYGVINLKHLFGVTPYIPNQAFELKMIMTAYWNIVLNGMVEFLALRLRFQMDGMVNKEIEMEIANKKMVNDFINQM